MSIHPFFSNHPFHLVNYSPWPLIRSIGAFSIVSGLIKWFHQYELNLFIIRNIIILLTIYQWWRDISRESTFQGLHSIYVIYNLRWGIILFIISEIFFFLSFFWAFFHSSLSPTIELGRIWPPIGIIIFNPFQVPLLNTTILLSSGISVTWSHYSLINNNYSQTSQRLFFTIILGIYFSILQIYEYQEASFSISDAIYGSTFFL